MHMCGFSGLGFGASERIAGDMRALVLVLWGGGEVRKVSCPESGM